MVRRMTQKLPKAVHKKIKISMRWFSYENDATILESRSTLVLRSPRCCSRTGNSSKLPRNLSAKAQSSNRPTQQPRPLFIILFCFPKNDNTHNQNKKKPNNKFPTAHVKIMTNIRINADESKDILIFPWIFSNPYQHLYELHDVQPFTELASWQ